MTLVSEAARTMGQRSWANRPPVPVQCPCCGTTVMVRRVKMFKACNSCRQRAYYHGCSLDKLPTKQPDQQKGYRQRSHLDELALRQRKAAMASLRQSGMTLAAIGKQYGISRERVRQILETEGELRPQYSCECKRCNRPFQTFVQHPKVCHLCNSHLWNMQEPDRICSVCHRSFPWRPYLKEGNICCHHCSNRKGAAKRHLKLRGGRESKRLYLIHPERWKHTPDCPTLSANVH